MVRLTTDLLVRCTSSYTKKRQDETRKQYLRRLTHLHLENRGIDEITDELASCHNLTVLYMYDNLLGSIPCLGHNANLTHLYLQNNNIEKMEGLSSLTRLTKLYIGNNCIVVVEGLESLYQLQELHVENQRLPAGEKMLFDARSIYAVSRSLSVLNISGNGISSLHSLEYLSALTQLTATNNKLRDLRELCSILSSSWPRIQKLDIAMNPLCRQAKYRDRIIVSAPALDILDGNEVTETAKKFLRSWQANKDAVRQRLPTSAPDASTMPYPEFNGTGYGDGLPKSASEIYPSIPSSYLMPALNGKKFLKFLARSRSQQSTRSGDPVDPRTALSGLLG